MKNNYIGFIYKWTNKNNNMFYIGSHKGNINDGYVGSGTLFKEEYKLNKIDFERKILEYVNNEENILVREQFYLDLYDVKNNKLSYNLNPKTSGGWKFCHESSYLINKRNDSIKDTFKNGRIIYNKDKKIEELYSEDVVTRLKQKASENIGDKFNRNKGNKGAGINNSNSKIVLIEYLHGNLKLICKGTFRKWCHSGSYKKDNKSIWKIYYLNNSYDLILYNDYIEYNGEKYTKEYLIGITKNKLLLEVHNRNYYLIEHIETNIQFKSDIPLGVIRKKLKGGFGKLIWNFNEISYEEFLKKEIKYYDGKSKICGNTIREYCSIL
jgi:hypothetical protein